MKSRTIGAALTLMLLTGGCATSGNVTDTTCAAFKPITVSKFDVLTPGTAAQIGVHNETWEALCPARDSRRM